MITDLKSFYKNINYFGIGQKETLIAQVESMESNPEGLADLIKLLDHWVKTSSSEYFKKMFTEIRNNYEAKNTIVECMEEIAND